MAGKPKFTVLHEQLRGQTFEIDREVMSIGRRDGMDICLKDSSMSGHHADLIVSEREGKKVYILRDNDSTNGTKVNGVPITEKELHNSDVVLFGSVEVLFDSGSIDTASAGGFTPTSVTLDLSTLDSGDGNVSSLKPLNPLAMKEAQDHKRTTIALVGSGVVLAVLIVVLLTWVILKFVSH